MRHLIDTCFSESIGDHGVSRADFEPVLAATAGALEQLGAAHRSGSLPLLRLPAAQDDLDALTGPAARFRKAFDDVVVLGTGGSSLGGQTLCALADSGFATPAGAPRLHFMDNVDSETFRALFAAIDPTRTGFIVISKSGSTAETLTQFLICLDVIRGKVGSTKAGRHFIAITEPTDNILRRLAALHGIETLDHDPGVGGRYAALSLVGLLPALIAGLDMHAVRRGAAETLEPVLSGAAPGDIPAACGAALAITMLRKRGIATTVLMPYVDRLAYFGLWFRQLWAESLGKNGAGTTPIRAIGTVDQHSQLQLYLDGPRDKMFTLILLHCAGTGPCVSPDLATDEALSYIAGRTMGDLMDAEQRATAATLARNGRPTRIIELETLDERVIGGLMMHFMLETIITAHLLGVDPYDQPAVEEGKVLTRQYLDQGAEGAGS